jgi:outer membrane protein assembly factor BamD (BamD/ComL family)
MIEEYMNFAHQNPANVRYVKNVMQNILTETEELEELETYLIQKVQKHPNDNIYSELLIWANLQMKNFYGAFIQARAMDKRQSTNGSETMEVGMIALKNKEYSTAIRIFDYIIENYNNSINYPMAKTYVIMAREEHIKNTFPIDTTQIRQLIHDYQSLISEIGINNTTLDALRNKALLHAFYLNEYDSAINLLERIIQVPRISSNLKAQCKIDLGDIYILTNQPWESTLLYSQVEKTMKETPVGYEAKLRNAKLSFYKGEFQLAQEHLDILKLATSREIANDAMQLSLLIQINSSLDTVMTALKKYASVELQLFRNRKLQALDSLNVLLNEYPSHNIADEVLLLMAEIQIELGEFNQALNSLTKILDNFGHDILADDAMFLQGKVYQDYLNDNNAAMLVYQEFLKKHPGSLYAAEARKRFRQLRGDFIN